MRAARNPRAGDWRDGMLLAAGGALAAAVWMLVSRRRRAAGSHQTELLRLDTGKWGAYCECGWDATGPNEGRVRRRAEAHATHDVEIVVPDRRG